MRIFHPVPVNVLPKELLLQEHHDTLKVLELIYAGSDDREVIRWEHHTTALYDRYQKSREYLNEVHKVNVVDLWPHHLRHDEGAFILYPEDSPEEVREIWFSIMIQGLGLEY